MARLRGFRAAFLRYDRVLSLTAIGLPFAVATLLGFAWLVEHGWLLVFIVVSLALSGLLAVIRLALRRLRRDAPEVMRAETGAVGPNPEWNRGETAAWTAARGLIRRRTAEPVDWAALPDVALEVVRQVATAMGERTPLAFTAPEALALIEQVASRYRGDLRRYLPFSDTVSVGAMWRIWEYREMLSRGIDLGQGAWRVLRAIKNPPVAVLREIEGALAGGHSGQFNSGVLAGLQAMLLEEVARAAVDLYSGHLRFTDSELLEQQLAFGDLDRARLARPDAPLRIVVAGQTSAGKSSLVNALLGEDAAETDAPPTTDRATTHPVVLGGMDCVLVDLPGLDGSTEARKATLAELAQADLVLWVMRANRPAREIDRAVLAEWRDLLAGQPERRPPPLLFALSAVDRLLDGWPRPEHAMSEDDLRRIATICGEVAVATGAEPPIPVSTLSPEWNLDALRARLVSHLGQALMVQRNRARLEAAPGLATELGRAAQGLAGLAALAPRLWTRGKGE